jgi:hypothetical protein
MAWEKLWTDGKRPGYSSDVKSLVYRRTHGEFHDAQIGQVGNVAHYERREAQYHCDVTLEFRGGVLEDYFTAGDRCHLIWGLK